MTTTRIPAESLPAIMTLARELTSMIEDRIEEIAMDHYALAPDTDPDENDLDALDDLETAMTRRLLACMLARFPSLIPA